MSEHDENGWDVLLALIYSVRDVIVSIVRSLRKPLPVLIAFLVFAVWASAKWDIDVPVFSALIESAGSFISPLLDSAVR